MKKIVNLVLVLSMMGLVACGNNKSIDNHVEDDKKEQTMVYDELSQKMQNAKTPLDYDVSDTVQSMKTVTFGSYPQSDTSGNSKEPIEWIVLGKENDKALLLSKDILQCKSYNDIATDITWETSTLRNWLNDYFYNAAFTDTEKDRIFTVNNENVNSELGAIGGNNTDDNVFCLSLAEVNKYFGEVDNDYISPNHNWRPMSFSTNYAKAQNNLGQLLFFSKDMNAKYYLSSEWWLRDMGFNNRTAAIVYCYGHAEGTLKAHNVDYAIRGVRPAIWVKYKKVSSSESSKGTPNTWISESGKHYYLDAKGKKIKNQWIEYNGDYYYLGRDGSMATNCWIEEKYYVNENGKMLKNTTTPDGHFVGEDGVYISNIGSDVGAVSVVTEEKLYADTIKKINKEIEYNLEYTEDPVPVSYYLGYQLYDFNKDGIKELFVFRMANQERYSSNTVEYSKHPLSRSFISESYGIENGKVIELEYRTYLPGTLIHLDICVPVDTSTDNPKILHFYRSYTYGDCDLIYYDGSKEKIYSWEIDENGEYKETGDMNLMKYNGAGIFQDTLYQ